MEDSCVDSERKARVRGLKRGPYKQRNKNGDLGSVNPLAENASMLTISPPSDHLLFPQLPDARLSHVQKSSLELGKVLLLPNMESDDGFALRNFNIFASARQYYPPQPAQSVIPSTSTAASPSALTILSEIACCADPVKSGTPAAESTPRASKACAGPSGTSSTASDWIQAAMMVQEHSPTATPHRL
ncbi:hypothetical protein HDU82_000255 [Entophlyctis luteolus]|nr:hypothetical protein HDU82_000255 [Entophlyctis luteolus]